MKYFEMLEKLEDLIEKNDGDVAIELCGTDMLFESYPRGEFNDTIIEIINEEFEIDQDKLVIDQSTKISDIIEASGVYDENL